jgi:four helix bundle protein
MEDALYEEWAKTVPFEITTDTIWRTPAYRLSLYAMASAQSDLHWLVRHRASRPHIDQLLRAVGGISASLDEGYSRSSGRERAHYYEYALGSAREARGWYFKCSVAAPRVAAVRIALLSRIIRILTAVIPRERESSSMKPKRREPRDQTTPPYHPAAASSRCSREPVPANSN